MANYGSAHQSRINVGKFFFSPPRFFYISKNSILALKKNSVRRNRIFSSSNFKKISVFRSQSWISRQKKIRFIETKFFMKDKRGNSGDEKNVGDWKRNLLNVGFES
jgi:hypothetical protein